MDLLKEIEILEEIYNVCNEIFKEYDDCFYTKEETKKMKEDKNNKLL